MKNRSSCALYVHIPFCRKKCFYCAFAVAVNQLQHRDAYLVCLSRECAAYQGIRLSSVYIGGGTPSILTESQFETLFSLIKRHFTVEPSAEVTIEMNPDDVTDEKLSVLRRCGVTRISVGVQTFSDEHLQTLGRSHSADDARRAIDTIMAKRFAAVSVDCMYGFPRQTNAEITADLDQLVALDIDHVSLYTFTRERGSLFFVRKVPIATDEEQAAQYRLISAQLERAGFFQYEISNFARPGKESRHNIGYWTGGNYIGIGMAAHGHVNGRRQWNEPRLPAYMDIVSQGRSPVVGSEELSAYQQCVETFLFGLRMTAGVDLGALEARYGVKLSVALNEKIAQFESHGFLTRQAGQIRTTPEGQLILDELCSRLIGE